MEAIIASDLVHQPFSVSEKINPRFSLRLNLIYYQIFGDDRDNNGSNRARNLNFRTNNTELSAMGVYNIIKRNGNYSVNRPQFSPYILFGIGRSTNSPKTFLPNDEGTIPSTYGNIRQRLKPPWMDTQEKSPFSPLVLVLD